MNAVAGAYDACVPMLLVSGAPPTAEYQSGKKLRLHHSVGGDLSATLRVFTPITAAVARIDSAEEAVATIDRLLQVALDEKKPVYLEIPYDMQKAAVPMPAPFNYHPPCGDEQVLRRMVDQVAAAVNKAEKVGVLVGLFVDRDGLEDVVAEMLARSNLPFATTFAQKAGYLEHLPNCVGCYQGATSPEVLDDTEGADILLTIGMPRAEFDLLGSTGIKEDCGAGRLLATAAALSCCSDHPTCKMRGGGCICFQLHQAARQPRAEAPDHGLHVPPACALCARGRHRCRQHRWLCQHVKNAPEKGHCDSRTWELGVFGQCVPDLDRYGLCVA